jgi:hypothetical protein
MVVGIRDRRVPGRAGARPGASRVQDCAVLPGAHAYPGIDARGHPDPLRPSEAPNFEQGGRSRQLPAHGVHSRAQAGRGASPHERDHRKGPPLLLHQIRHSGAVGRVVEASPTVRRRMGNASRQFYRQARCPDQSGPSALLAVESSHESGVAQHAAPDAVQDSGRRRLSRRERVRVLHRLSVGNSRHGRYRARFRPPPNEAAELCLHGRGEYARQPAARHCGVHGRHTQRPVRLLRRLRERLTLPGAGVPRGLRVRSPRMR